VKDVYYTCSDKGLPQRNVKSGSLALQYQLKGCASVKSSLLSKIISPYVSPAATVLKVKRFLHPFHPVFTKVEQFILDSSVFASIF